MKLLAILSGRASTSQQHRATGSPPSITRNTIPNVLKAIIRRRTIR